jgi:hypothetical protein
MTSKIRVFFEVASKMESQVEIFTFHATARQIMISLQTVMNGHPAGAD